MNFNKDLQFLVYPIMSFVCTSHQNGNVLNPEKKRGQRGRIRSLGDMEGVYWKEGAESRGMNIYLLLVLIPV